MYITLSQPCTADLFFNNNNKNNNNESAIISFQCERFCNKMYIIYLKKIKFNLIVRICSLLQVCSLINRTVSVNVTLLSSSYNIANIAPASNCQPNCLNLLKIDLLVYIVVRQGS